LPTHPIYTPDPPTKPTDPNAPIVWPPLPPDVSMPGLILVWVVGVGYRWLHVPQPKA
jgi:hypothetical protein